MRYTLVTETFSPDINGAAMVLRRLAESLAARGVEVEVVRPAVKDSAYRSMLDGREIEIHGLPIPRHDGLQFGLPSGKLLTGLWQKRRPDIVHVATEGPLGWSAVKTARKLGLPIVSSFHTNFHAYCNYYHCGVFSRLVLAYLRVLHNRTLATYVPEQALQQSLSERGFKNTRVLGRGVDTELFGAHRRSQALRASWGVEADAPVLLYVGRVAPEKNIALLFSIYRRLKAACEELVFVVVGEGCELSALRKHHPEVFFAGVRRDLDLAEHYASADLFVFPSETETFGNVVLEALASSLVFIGFDYAAAGRHVTDGENGYKVALGHGQELCRAALGALASRDAWPALRKRARQAMLREGWGPVIERYVRDIEITVNAQGTAPATDAKPGSTGISV